MQKNPLGMTLKEIECELEAAKARVQADAVLALGSEEAVREYKRMQRKAEQLGSDGDRAFDMLRCFEEGLTGDQRRLLFGDRDDPRLEPEELDRLRLAFEPAQVAERPADLFPELRRNFYRVDFTKIEELASLSGTDISRRLPGYVAAIRIREALIRLRAFGMTRRRILRGVFQDGLRQGIDPDDAWSLVSRWVDLVEGDGTGKSFPVVQQFNVLTF